MRLTLTEEDRMTISRIPYLVSCSFLKSRLQTVLSAPNHVKDQGPEPPLRVLDTSWMRADHVNGYTEFFRRGHIPGAVHFDLDTLHTSGPETLAACPIPSQRLFRDYVRSLGISNSDHLVVYDSADKKPSFRTWYLFRLFGHDKISVLDGGLQQWVREGNPVEVGDARIQFHRPSFQVNYQPNLLATYAQMLDIIKNKSAQVVDARSSDSPNFEPLAPGTFNVPFNTLFKEDGTFKSNKELELLFLDSDVDLQKPLVTSCQTGVTACGLALAGLTVGAKDVAVYNGSHHEWKIQQKLAAIATDLMKQGIKSK